jgi:hypothetical protein
MDEGKGIDRRRALVVKPIFTYPIAVRRSQTSWRNWGGIESREDADREAARIRSELDRLAAAADFPLRFLPLVQARRGEELPEPKDMPGVDALLVYAGGDGGGDLMASVDPIARLGMDAIFLVRNKTSPLYYWYEGAMARFLHNHTDRLAHPGIGYDDVVVDRPEEVLWRLRALCGLRNAAGSRVVVVEGAGGIAEDGDGAGREIADRWKIDVRPVSGEELGKRIREARGDAAASEAARRRAEEWLALPGTTLEAAKGAVLDAFLVEGVLRDLLESTGSRVLALGGCRETVLPVSGTTACVALSALNDAGYVACCDAGFGALPAAILLDSIAGRPPFLAHPAFPHEGLITLARCTAPRRMDGKTAAPARILTHFESDAGAAPAVAMEAGRRVTNIIPDFAGRRWVGLPGEIAGRSDLPICRTQAVVRFSVESRRLAERMPGFPWVTASGDFLREVRYALRRVPVEWEPLG